MNITLRNPSAFPNINFGSTDGLTISTVYFNTLTNTLYAHQIVELSGLSMNMQISSTGIIYIKGNKIIDTNYVNKFVLDINGNLIANAFITEL